MRAWSARRVARSRRSAATGGGPLSPVGGPSRRPRRGPSSVGRLRGRGGRQGGPGGVCGGGGGLSARARTGGGGVGGGAGAGGGGGRGTATFAPHPPFLLQMPDEAAVALAHALHERGEEVLAVNGA